VSKGNFFFIKIWVLPLVALSYVPGAAATDDGSTPKHVTVDLLQDGTQTFQIQNNHYDYRRDDSYHTIPTNVTNLETNLKFVTTGVYIVDHYADGWAAPSNYVDITSRGNLNIGYRFYATESRFSDPANGYQNDYRYGVPNLFRAVGPAEYLLFVGSGGTAGMSVVRNDEHKDKDIYRGGGGGTVSIRDDENYSPSYSGGGAKTTLSLTGVFSATDRLEYSSIYKPDAAAIYVNTTGGPGGASDDQNLHAGDAGNAIVSLTQQNEYIIDVTSNVGSGAVWAGVSVSSIGGAGGNCCVYKPDSNGEIDKDDKAVASMAHTADSTGRLYSWNTGADYNSTGAIVQRFGKNGNAGTVTVELAEAQIGVQGSNADDRLVGVSAASLGGAKTLPFLLLGQGTMPAPGNGGSVIVTLDNSSMSLGAASEATNTPEGMVGVFASSGSEPFYLLSNVTEIKGVPLAGDVTVKLTESTLGIVGSDSEGALATGVWAAATGGYQADPWVTNASSDLLGLNKPGGANNDGLGLTPSQQVQTLSLPGSFAWAWETGSGFGIGKDDGGFGNAQTGAYQSTPYNLGAGAKVDVELDAATLTIAGNNAVGIVALSSAGSHGSGTGSQGNNWGVFDGDVVTVTASASSISVSGSSAVGVYAASLGAGGLQTSVDDVDVGFANGAGDAPFTRLVEYKTGDGITDVSTAPIKVIDDAGTGVKKDGADGADVDVTINNSSLTVQATTPSNSPTGPSWTPRAYGIVAQSIGSSGGLVFGKGAWFHGSKGGNAGDGGIVKVSASNNSILNTVGESAVAVLAQSIGGGGGAGGSKTGFFVALGGNGGAGGNGGSVQVDFNSGTSVTTYGDFAAGVVAHSIGGGGGHGGSAKAFGGFFSTSKGGVAGDAGNGGSVALATDADASGNYSQTFQTHGQHAHGIVLQSVGGGGGVGGSANSYSAGVIASFAVALGGSGGNGGDGGAVRGGRLDLKSSDKYPGAKSSQVYSNIVTKAHDSSAIVLQSVGGGGGIGGSSSAKSLAAGLGAVDPELEEVPTISASFSFGGSGGGGGKGGSVTYWHIGNIGTYGDSSNGIMAHSVGGGGGSGGDATATSKTVGKSSTQVKLNFSLGGKAGVGSDGGEVWLQAGSKTAGVPTVITTVGHDSTALFAQSVGGGGGNAGSGSGLNFSVQHKPSADDPKPKDKGGNIKPIADSPPSNVARNPATSSNQGATSTMAPENEVKDDADGGKSFWANARTCLKKSIVSGDITTKKCEEPEGQSPDSYGLAIDVGRDGGGSGVGGAVTVNLLDGGVSTNGSGSHGIFAQSVGGGGGKASAAGADGAGSKNFAATINVGGDGGEGGKGGSVTVTNDGVIVTGQLYDMDNPTATDATKFTAPAVIGGDAHGIFAQSVGGSGGSGGNADPHSAAPASAINDLLNGKYETAALAALGVSKSDISDLNAARAAAKWKWTGKAPKLSITPTINVGGKGGSGGHGDTVTVANNGQIQTFGHRSYGVFAQSVGGGGGLAGSASGALVDLSLTAELSGIDFAPTVNIGGSGGAGGNGGDVTYRSTIDDSSDAAQPLIITRGYASSGVFAQSVGGGGGLAHEGSTFGLSATIGADGDLNATSKFNLGNGQSSVTISANANSASAKGYTFGTQSTGVENSGANAVCKNDGDAVSCTDDNESNSGSGNDDKSNSGSGGAINLGATDSYLQGGVVTHGDDAAGLFGQSIGGGGGVATMGCTNSNPSNATHYASACYGNTSVSNNAGQSGQFTSFTGIDGISISVNGNLTTNTEKDGGEFGHISVYSEQNIQTFGARSFGIALQAVSGGGGFFSVPSISLNQVTMPSYQRGGDGASSSDEVGIDVNLSSSTITTRGAGAWGLFAQMVQGGGGFFGDSSQRLAMIVSDASKPNSVTSVNTKMNVALTDSTIHVFGSQAHGIVLQSLGAAGGIWQGEDPSLNMGVSLGDLSQPAINGGSISLTLTNSRVQNYGSTAERDSEGNYVRENGEIVLSKKVTGHGVVIQSDGAGPGGAASKISVKLENGSTISTDYGIALMMVGGSYDQQNPNIVNVDSGTIYNFGSQHGKMSARDDTDSSENYWAIYAPSGYTDVTIGANGKVHGNVLLGIVTRGELTNHGELRAATVQIADNSLHNYGVIYAGGDGFTTGLYVDGSLKHYKGGEIHVDVDAVATNGPTHDVITVTSLARIEGEIVPQTQSLLPGNYQFLTAGTLEHSGTIRDALVFGWDATVNGNTLSSTPTANFAPAGFSLTDNQASLAGYLQRSWDAATADHAKLFGYLHEYEAGDHGNYRTTLNDLMGDTLNTQPIQFQTAFSTYMSESLACPAVTEQGLRLNQDDCAWAKVTGDISDQSSNSSNPGFRATGGGLRLGAQKTVGGGWTVGFGAGYALNYLTSTNFSSNGQFFDLSLSAKKQIEQWEFGASLGFAQGWFQNNRYRTMGANGAAEAMEGVFASDSRMTIMGVRLRAAYEHELQKDHYLKPYVDVDLSYSSMPGFSETGTAPLALKVGSSSRWNVAITPMLEYGLDVLTADKTRVKLFASAGASFLPNNNHKSETSFVGASAALGTFDVITEGPEILGRLNLGIQAFQSDDLEVRAQYGLLAGDGYWSQSVSANLVWRF